MPPAEALNLASTEPTRRSLTGREVLTLIWGLGCALGLVRLLVAHARHRSLIRTCSLLEDAALQETLEGLKMKLGIRRSIQLLSSPHIASAAVTGSIHSKLIVSPDFLRRLTSQQQQHVLTHELIHIKRFDPFINWISLVLQAVHWFNPLVHWALKKFQQDRELVCDAIAIKSLGEDQRRAYGETLIEILMSFRQQRTFPNLVPIISNKQEIKRRIMMITKNQLPPTKRPILLFAALAVVLALSFTKPGLAKAQSSGTRAHSYSVAKGDAVDLEVTIDADKGVAASSSTRIKLRDVSNREARSGVLIAPGAGKQMYNVHEIDLTAFPSGGILIIDIRMGDGESAGSFDLFPEGVPLPSASPEGSVARQYDVNPGESRTLVHQFAKGGTFRFGASGNWFSEEGSTNQFNFEARAIPLNNGGGEQDKLTSIREFHIGSTPEIQSGTIHFSSKAKGNNFSFINDEGATLDLESDGTVVMKNKSKKTGSIFHRNSKNEGEIIGYSPELNIRLDDNETIDHLDIRLEPDHKQNKFTLKSENGDIIEFVPNANVTISSELLGGNKIRTDKGTVMIRSSKSVDNKNAKPIGVKSKLTKEKGSNGEVIHYRFNTEKKDSKKSSVLK